MNIPLMNIREARLEREEAGGLLFRLEQSGRQHIVQLDRDRGLRVGVNGIPSETWLWLRLLVSPLVEWSVAHGGHLPPDGIAVHLVLRAAHLANIPREQIRDLRPDPLATWDSEPPLTPTPR